MIHYVVSDVHLTGAKVDLIGKDVKQFGRSRFQKWLDNIIHILNTPFKF